MGQERNHPLTEAEEIKHKGGTPCTPIEKILLDRIWNRGPDEFAIKMPTEDKAGRLDLKKNIVRHVPGLLYPYLGIVHYHDSIYCNT